MASNIYLVMELRDYIVFDETTYDQKRISSQW